MPEPRLSTTVTQGASARSTAEPAARAAAELHEGRLSALGVAARADAVDDPEVLLVLLDMEPRRQ